MALTENLIRLVKMNPILYDLSHEDHKNSRKRDQVWEHIAEELGEDIDELKKKWKNLRDIFLRYIKKRKRGKCAKKWHWASQMESFNPSLTFVKTDATEIPSKYRVSHSYKKKLKVEPDPIETDTEFIEEFLPEPVFVDFSKKSKLKDTVFDDFPKKSKLQPPSKLPAESCSTKPESPLSIKRKQLTSSVNSLLKTFNDIKTDDFDDIDMLFLAHARTIKKLSKKRQVVAKMKISQVIMEQELQNLEEESSTNLNHHECFRDHNGCCSVEQSRSDSNCELEGVLEYNSS